jgi:hypothetical protein
MVTSVNKNFDIVDTKAPLNYFAKNGFYTVGNSVFNHKILALQRATATRLPMRWNFNDEAYKNLDWTVSNGVPLPTLYKLRAQQLRSKYQYLILCWSGGADSTTILDTFLKNNIPLDEIVVLWPRSQTQNRYQAQQDTKATNMLSEWDFAIQPKLDWIRQHYPKQKITIGDVMAQPNADEYADDTVLIAEKHNYGTIQRWRELDKIIRARTQTHHNLATIMGVHPPSLVMLDDKYFVTFFMDTDTSPGSKSDYMLDGTPRNIEFFYMTPDFPELVREQCHVMATAANSSAMIKHSLDHLHMQPDGKFISVNRNFDSEWFRQVRKKILYPDYPINTLQVHKQSDTHDRAEWFDWFYSNPHSQEYLLPWRSAIQSHQALIDPGYFKMVNGRVGGYQTFYSKFYIIGKVNDNNQIF